MTEPIYFQWQNEVLLKTIYPSRALKLIDFLVYFREVELWAETDIYYPLSDLEEVFTGIKPSAVTDGKLRSSSITQHSMV